MSQRIKQWVEKWYWNVKEVSFWQKHMAELFDISYCLVPTDCWNLYSLLVNYRKIDLQLPQYVWKPQIMKTRWLLAFILALSSDLDYTCLTLLFDKLKRVKDVSNKLLPS